MKSIKAKINLVMFLILGTALSFGYLAYKRNNKLETTQERVAKSLLIRDEIKDLDLNKHTDEITRKLKKYKESFTESERYEALSNLIQAYNSNNKKLFKRRRSEFEKTEQKFFKVSQWIIQKHKQEVQFYILLGTILPLLGLCGLIYYFNYGILSPLQTLSNRMMEFLIDQYTFRFSSPPNNEIGNLERTFNSLAQKVLNNMDELLALDRAKSEFVSIASHELRTPLTSIKGSLGLLSNEIVGTLDEDAKEMVMVAEHETDRLVRLINDMLDLAKIESRSLTLKKEWASLPELFHATKLSLHGFAASAEVRLDSHILHPLENCEINMDSDRIQQVLTNLISNAIKYSPKGGLVTLKAIALNQEQVEISINDQGPGISEENQNLIFEKFRQATDSTHPLVKGTGLGLAISKALVEEHEGQIGVRSKEGLGSTFYFILPSWRNGNTISQQERKAA